MVHFNVPQVELLGVSEAAVLRGLQMLDRRPSHGMVYLSSPPKNHYQASLYLLKFMLHEYIVLLLPLHPVDRVARGRHEALCERAAAAGGDAAAGRGQLGGQAAGGGVGQADGGGRHEGLQVSAVTILRLSSSMHGRFSCGETCSNFAKHEHCTG